MPNRILRDWTDSDRVNDLSAESERFFARLIMKVDDFGRYYAEPKRLKAFLFPLKPQIRETDCSHWSAECAKAGLIRFYDMGGKRFLEILNFGQRLRSMRSIFPQPPPIDSSPPSNDGHSPPDGGGLSLESKLNRNESNPKLNRQSARAREGTAIVNKPTKSKKLNKEQKDLADRIEAALGKQWVNDAGKWINRIKKHFKTMERVISEVESALKEERIKKTSAQYAEQIWKEFHG